MKTRWTEGITPENAHREYPRPLMIRDRWLCLNGLWDYAITGEERPWAGGRIDNARQDLLLQEPTPPEAWDGEILVPFCPESKLSGVGRLVRPDQILWYRRRFVLPEDWAGNHVLLHFQAVDWHAIVWVNGIRMGENRGGYIPFEFDITNALRSGKDQEVLLAVWDPTDLGYQGRGKQNLPETQKGYRYTPTTGIWQTVWAEPVPVSSIRRLVATPDLDTSSVRITVDGGRVRVVLKEGAREIADAEGEGPLVVTVPQVRTWSPSDPFLYDLDVELLDRSDNVVDKVRSYFGMRKVTIEPDDEGHPLIRLNDEELFQVGPLDQGYWPDGILTPPTDAAAIYDLQYLKDIGCNMTRAHVKVQPDRWYHHCDRLGLVVWQDTVCYRDTEEEAGAENIAQWEEAQGRMIRHLEGHPSVIMWTVFNEGWGQHDTERLTDWFGQLDPTRIISNASGWWDRGVGQIYDVHNYSFHPAVPITGETAERAVVIGEAGGFELLVPDHTWPDLKVTPTVDPDDDVNREVYADADTFARRYREWAQGVLLLKRHGLNAVVYTQISDVEHESNGWLTYDRAVSKLPKHLLQEVHRSLYGPPPELVPLEVDWRWRTGAVNPNWASGGFDDTGWEENSGGQPVIVALDELPMLWRARIDGGDLPVGLVFRFIGNGTAEILLEGHSVKKIYNERSDYTAVADVILGGSFTERLAAGANTLAVRLTAEFPRDNVRPREGRVRRFALQLLTMGAS